MFQWEYQITIHELPERQAEKQKDTIECDQDGLCFVHDVFQGGIEWLEGLFFVRKGRKAGSCFNPDTITGSSFAYGRREKKSRRGVKRICSLSN
jgi:hypothetical protein